MPKFFSFEKDQEKVAFALFFHSYSTFLAKPGLYLEDLYVKEAHRGQGYGKKLLAHLAKIAVERNCGRLEWSVLIGISQRLISILSLSAKPMSEWTVHRLTGDALVQLSKQVGIS